VAPWSKTGLSQPATLWACSASPRINWLLPTKGSGISKVSLLPGVLRVSGFLSWDLGMEYFKVAPDLVLCKSTVALTCSSCMGINPYITGDVIRAVPDLMESLKKARGQQPLFCAQNKNL
jgi:hypothetical protein